MPEPGMGANNDHSSASVGPGAGGSSVSDASTSSSTDDTTADSLANSDTTAESLSSQPSFSDHDSPTTAESIANAATTADALADSPTTAESLSAPAPHGYDEVPSVEATALTPAESGIPTAVEIDNAAVAQQVPAGVPNEYADLFGVTPNPVGGVDAVWANGDGTYSSSDGTTYDPATGDRSYDPGEDSFATNRTSIGIGLDGSLVETTHRDRHPDRVRSSEALALVEHDPKNLASTYGNRVAFDYYNNPNMDSIRDEALMHAAAAANEPVSGRYPGENMAYIGVVPPTAHLARTIRNSRTTPVNPIGRTPEQHRDLARDPAHNGRISPKSEREREVGLALERSGEVPGPITRDPTGGAEFVDAKGQAWDVKAFNSNFPPQKGGFDVARDARKVDNALKTGENIMLDTQNLSLADRQALQREAVTRDWGDRVKFW